MVNLSSLEIKTHNDVNHYRSSHGKAPLNYDESIAAIARSHSQALANNRNQMLVGNPLLKGRGLVINHDGFDKRFKQIRTIFPSIRSASENVAANYNARSPVKTAVEGWINSSGHERNMVGNYTKTGIGIARSSDNTYFFTQLFAK